jgi:dTDP-4-amino-4,6-dideoxygalactose transaminase
MSPKYFHRYVGGNFRMDALQAALLNIKLKHIGKYIGARTRNAKFYLEKLAHLEDAGHIALPKVAPGNSHTWNQFTVKVRGSGRDDLKRHLSSRGIGCEVYYPLPLNRQECFLEHANALPVSELLAQQSLSLPIYPELPPNQLNFAVTHIENFFEHFPRA